MEPLAAGLPRDTHLFHLDAHPSHFLLEAKVFHNLRRVVASLHWQQHQGLSGYGEQNFLGTNGHFHIHHLSHVLSKVVTVATQQILLVIGSLHYLRCLSAWLLRWAEGRHPVDDLGRSVVRVARRDAVWLVNYVPVAWMVWMIAVLRRWRSNAPHSKVIISNHMLYWEANRNGRLSEWPYVPRLTFIASFLITTNCLDDSCQIWLL